MSKPNRERAVIVIASAPTEFRELSRSAGADVIAEILISADSIHAKYFVGTGKLQEIKQLVTEHRAELVLFSSELSPSQERNIERELKCRVLSRTGLILDIFAQRAVSLAGKLQVELAQLQHLRTRLIRGWTHLERQKGGIGLRGPGETQLELDRRMINDKIKYITGRLKKVQQQRDQSRNARMRNNLPTIALVGYTNAGKSSLFNALTGANTQVENKLFATLDPKLAAITLPHVGKVIIADTVGFVHDLPHKLIKAFKATLEETSSANLLLHVVDRNDANWQQHISQVNEVLADLGADLLPTIMVHNKIDLLNMEPNIVQELSSGGKVVSIAAISAMGIDLLMQCITDHFMQQQLQGYVTLPPAESKARAALYDLHAVAKEWQLENGHCKLQLRLSHRHWQSACKQYGLMKYFSETEE